MAVPTPNQPQFQYPVVLPLKIIAQVLAELLGMNTSKTSL